MNALEAFETDSRNGMFRPDMCDITGNSARLATHAARRLSSVTEGPRRRCRRQRGGAAYYVTRISGLGSATAWGTAIRWSARRCPTSWLDDGIRLADHTHEGRALLVDLAGDDPGMDEIFGTHNVSA